ncbi:MAG TPA: hypothetical protein PK303_04745 [bacterium]|nr:hypothetical protein [bacterium]HOL35052.1 hypothetical protein [bacterium]HPP08413.1 hypothetical protein [bacterium]
MPLGYLAIKKLYPFFIIWSIEKLTFIAGVYTIDIINEIRESISHLISMLMEMDKVKGEKRYVMEKIEQLIKLLSKSNWRDK